MKVKIATFLLGFFVVFKFISTLILLNAQLNNLSIIESLLLYAFRSYPLFMLALDLPLIFLYSHWRANQELEASHAIKWIALSIAQIVLGLFLFFLTRMAFL